MPSQHPFCNNSGFTLIEAMVVVSILALTLAVGLPNFSAFVNDNRISGNANEFIGAMTLARSEAVARGRLVTICRSENPNASSPSCAAGANWNTGWVVFVENASGSGVGTFDEGETIIARQAAMPKNTNASGNLSALTFNAMGAPTGGAVSAAFNFNYDGLRPREVCINRNGRVKVVQGGKDASACN